jgi:hypothetical protein
MESSPRPPYPMTLIQAIAVEEGMYVQPGEPEYPTRPQVNNNPCDLEWHQWMTTYGSTKGDPRFAIFPTVEMGFSAARHLFGFPLYRGKTISQALSIFAPGNENDLRQYILNVCSWTEQQPETVIDGILG